MDLAVLDDITRTIEVLHPATKLPIGLEITLYSMENKAVKQAQRLIQNKRMAMKSEDVTAEILERQNLELLASAFCSWEWKGEATFKGEKLEFNKDNVMKVLSVGWIKDQVNIALGDTASFFPN